MSAAPGERRARSVGSAVLITLGSISLAVAMVAGWIDRNVFDSREFAARAVVVLDDATVRRVVADEVADQLTKSGSSILVSYRSVLLPIVEDVVGTPAFRSIFRSAVEEANRTAVSRHAGQATLEMGETLKMLTSTAAVTSPGLADALENQASSLLIDAAPVLDRLDLWRVGERVRWARRSRRRAHRRALRRRRGRRSGPSPRRAADRRGHRGRGSRGRARHVDRAEGGLGPHPRRHAGAGGAWGGLPLHGRPRRARAVGGGHRRRGRCRHERHRAAARRPRPPTTAPASGSVGDDHPAPGSWSGEPA